MSIRIGVDVGGTFTDLVACDTETGVVISGKVASTPDAPERAVVQAVERFVERRDVARCEYFLHGTTVGLNALLQRSGAKVGLLSTEGFRDVLEIRRGSREEMLNLWWRPPRPLVRRRLRLPVRERTRADGLILHPPDDGQLAAAAEMFAAEEVDAVAIAFINAYKNPRNELAAAEGLRRHGFSGEISLSHDVSGEYREFERTSTTVVDAYVKRVSGGYLERLTTALRNLGCQGSFLMMRSGGGAMTFDEASRRPFETIISGPVAGAEGAAAIAAVLGHEQVIAADVGGTSFDVAVIINGRPQTLNEGQVVGFPIQSPWMDVRSIGAGGGSIAEIQPGGLMRVGPRSAGSVPGPACYSRGGSEPTVTDAALHLGMLGDGLLANSLRLDAKLAVTALNTLTGPLALSTLDVAAGIIRVATARMVDAIHEISVERGLDPRQGSLMVFGGAGGLFATLLAREAEIRSVIIPPYSGNFSAWGLLGADITQTAAKTNILPLAEETVIDVRNMLAELTDTLRSRPGNGGSNGATLEAYLDLRYKGQEYTLTIPAPTLQTGTTGNVPEIAHRFETEYETVFGHRMEEDIEVVAVRATQRQQLPRLALDAPSRFEDAPPRGTKQQAFSFTQSAYSEFALVDRESLSSGHTLLGPALIREETSMTYVDNGFSVSVDKTGCLVIVDTEETASYG